MLKPMGKDLFPHPPETRYFEDYVAGSVHEFGPIEVDEAEVIAFAKRFDPQVFHTDPTGAKQTPYGRLIASGWHTSALMMRLFVEHYLPRGASLGSPGVDALRWLKPVYPGDALSVRVTVVQTARSRTKPDRGIVRSFIEVINQHGEVAMTVTGVNLILCRDPA
jgi:acyl dehydratase